MNNNLQNLSYQQALALLAPNTLVASILPVLTAAAIYPAAFFKQLWKGPMLPEQRKNSMKLILKLNGLLGIQYIFWILIS